jgi:hypothetical protein
MYMLILNFTYPLRCLRVPPVEYHCLSRPRTLWKATTKTGVKERGCVPDSSGTGWGGGVL